MILSNGMPQLIPNDSSITMQDQAVLPELNRVATECSTMQSNQSCKLFQQGNLTFMHINARSLHQSHDEIVALLTVGEHKSDFLMISESWLDPHLVNSYQIPNYDMYHSIPKASHVGKGSAIYVIDHLAPYCERIDDFCVEEPEFQSIFLRVKCPDNPIFIVGAVYRSPSYPLSTFMPYLETTLNCICNINKTCFIGGDWNADLFQCNGKPEVKSFLDCLNSYGFFPTISVPSRISNSPPYSQTLIDNIFTNALDTIKHSCASCVGIADHQTVICTSDLLRSHPPQGMPHVSTPRFSYNRIEELKENIAHKLTDFHIDEDVEQNVKNFSELIQKEIGRLSTSHLSRRFTPIQPWITPGLLRSINKKNSLLRHFLKFKTHENEQKYRAYRNVLRLSIRHSKKTLLSKTIRKKTQIIQNISGQICLKQ